MIELFLLDTLSAKNDGKDKFGNTPPESLLFSKTENRRDWANWDSPKWTDAKLGLKCFKGSPDPHGFQAVRDERETDTYAQPVWPSG